MYRTMPCLDWRNADFRHYNFFRLELEFETTVKLFLFLKKKSTNNLYFFRITI